MKVVVTLVIICCLSACSLTQTTDTALQQNQVPEQPQIELPQTPTVDEQRPIEVEQTISEEAITALNDDPNTSNDEQLPAEVITYDNLWDDIGSQLQFDIPDNSRVNAQKKWYLRHPNYMQRVSNRAEPFLYYITEQLKQANMPMELALLPIVESAFDPFAYSHGRASGMWQFIPGTGKRFGMPQTWWYDGRRDVVASTQGAIKYLQYLHKMFDGNWLHALAAYNSGEGRVLKAIKKNKRAGKATDFWSLQLPKETRAYVPKLLALADILKHQQKYNFVWPKIANQPAIDVIDVGSQIDLALAAQLSGLDIDEVQRLNPGYNRWATDPKGPHTLVIPLKNKQTFSDALAQTTPKQRLNWVRHKVKNGESIGVIAQKYKSSVDVIKQVNDMRNNTIYVNDYLLIPVALRQASDYALSLDERLNKTQSIARASNKVTHQVKQGDTLWDIAMLHKVKVRSLAKWNNMAPTDPLKLGRNLVIWTDLPSKKNGNASVMRKVVYTVRSGDSLARIANRFKVKVSDLTKWNKLQRNKYLQPGQKLTIQVDVTQTFSP